MAEEKEDKDLKKTTSRKWIVTVWCLLMGSVIVVCDAICAFMGRPIPEGFAGLCTLLFSTGIVYIGGNVWQKQIQQGGFDK